jgi:hypothetical protein
MGISVIAGRNLSKDDTASSPRVAIVNQTFVHDFLGSGNPLGQTMRTSPEPNYPATVYEIVGVIPDTQYNDLRGQTPPMTLAPASQFPGQGPWANVMIHSDIPSSALAATIKRTIAAKNPGVILEFNDFQQQIRDGLIQERLMAMLSGFFGLLAVLLTMIGLYGVISYIVQMRRNELGIRIALGASRQNVVRIILQQTVGLLVIGLSIGVLIALAATRGASALLFGLQPHDPLSYTAASVLLAVVALLASFLPARRASRVNPMVALRDE